jgi:hypothetical protein
MAELSPQEVGELARAAGIELDDPRAATIAARMSAVLEELDTIPDEALAEVEPFVTFVVEEESHE